MFIEQADHNLKQYRRKVLNLLEFGQYKRWPHRKWTCRRAGKEILYFRSHIILGVSSAITAPTIAGVPITQRGVSESFIVRTGVGRKGKDVLVPCYVRSRTLILLMGGVARLPQIITVLVDPSNSQNRVRWSSFSSIYTDSHHWVCFYARSKSDHV